MELQFEVLIKVQRPVAEVFDAVYDPQKLSGYFTNGGASAPLDAGTTVEWAFEDTPGERIAFPVEVDECERNKHIAFRWQGAGPENLNRVDIRFEATGETETLVKVSEGGWESNDDGLKRSYSNCMGWSQMLSALKAYAEYGIDLRKGAYRGLFKAGGDGSA